MSTKSSDWLTLSDASELLGVHPSTLRRWADDEAVPCVRTPGGHRRFRQRDLNTWAEGGRSVPMANGPDHLVQSAVGHTRQEMARQQVSHESWYTAFALEKDRQEMRDSGRRLFGLAVQYMSRTKENEPVLHEGQRIGSFYGAKTAEQGISLVDTVRALSFFRESLLQAASPGQGDEEDMRIRHQLRCFMDEVLYACLATYETAVRLKLAAAS